MQTSTMDIWTWGWEGGWGELELTYSTVGEINSQCQLLWQRKLSSTACHDLDWWDGGALEGGPRGGDVHIQIADSFRCITETSTSSSSNFIPT